MVEDGDFYCIYFIWYVLQDKKFTTFINGAEKAVYQRLKVCLVKANSKLQVLFVSQISTESFGAYTRNKMQSLPSQFMQKCR